MTGMRPLVLPPAEWAERAACRDEDPELFYPVGEAGAALAQIERAKTVCRRCAVIDACAAWAIEADERFGVWGGLSDVERRRLARGYPWRNCERCAGRFVGRLRNQKHCPACARAMQGGSR